MSEIIQETKPSIQLILNDGGRLEQFRGLFENLAKHNAGKLTSTHFCVNTDILIHPRNAIEQLFVKLQNQTHNKGIRMNCFCFNIVIPEDEKKTTEEGI